MLKLRFDASTVVRLNYWAQLCRAKADAARSSLIRPNINTSIQKRTQQTDWILMPNIFLFRIYIQFGSHSNMSDYVNALPTISL